MELLSYAVCGCTESARFFGQLLRLSPFAAYRVIVFFKLCALIRDLPSSTGLDSVLMVHGSLDRLIAGTIHQR